MFGKEVIFYVIQAPANNNWPVRHRLSTVLIFRSSGQQDSSGVHSHSTQHGHGDASKLVELCQSNEHFARQHQDLCTGAAHGRHR